MVHQRKCADAAARQRLGQRAADAADADDGDMRLLQTAHALFPKQ